MNYNIFVHYGLTERKLYKKQIMQDTIQTQDVIRRGLPNRKADSYNTSSESEQFS